MTVSREKRHEYFSMLKQTNSGLPTSSSCSPHAEQKKEIVKHLKTHVTDKKKGIDYRIDYPDKLHVETVNVCVSLIAENLFLRPKQEIVSLCY